MKKTLPSSIMLSFILLLGSCGTARRGEPVFKPVPLANQEVTQGQVVYMRYCQKCHPGGAAGLGPAINNKPLPGFMIRFQVRNGVGMMPAFKEEVIADRELDELVVYMKTLRKAKEKPM